MRRIVTAFAITLAITLLMVSLASCTSGGDHENWTRYGTATAEAIDVHATPQVAIGAIAETASPSSTIKVEGIVFDVCAVKGCWMTVRDADGVELLVRFRDYGFFVPRNAMGRQVWVVGTAERQVLSVEALQHLAQDAGKTPAEIAAITKPQEKLTFMADAAWIKGPGLQDPYRPIGKETCPPVDAGSSPFATSSPEK